MKEEPQEGKPNNIPKVKHDPSLKQIRTFQGDVADAINRQKESLVSIQRAEQVKSMPAEVKKSPEEKARLKSIVLLSLSFALVIAGGTGGWFTYRKFSSQQAPPVYTPPPGRLITPNKEATIGTEGLSRESLIRLVAENEQGIKPGELKHLILPIEASKLFEVLKAKAPGNMIRALDPEFMLGILGQPPSVESAVGTASVFLIIKVNSFENVFPGMLAWEESMLEDIGPLFATRLKSLGMSEENPFEDQTFKNKDARVLKDTDGTTVIIYSFLDAKTLIITDSERSLETLMGRLTLSSLSR
ncbi:MAG: hypothetical protein Q8O98_01920 [bacterium]|nr:hypothetical protein [bacterium]